MEKRVPASLAAETMTTSSERSRGGCDGAAAFAEARDAAVGTRGSARPSGASSLICARTTYWEQALVQVTRAHPDRSGVPPMNTDRSPTQKTLTGSGIDDR